MVAVAVSQYCPLCAPPSCTLTNTGLSTCSQCEYGALFNVSIIPPNNTDGFGDLNIGVCQPCPQGCTNNCTFGVISPSMSVASYVNICNECEKGFIYNYSSGGCARMPPNCATGTCMGDTCYSV